MLKKLISNKKVSVIFAISSDRVFSPENVMLQLKYRYDREADLAQR